MSIDPKDDMNTFVQPDSPKSQLAPNHGATDEISSLPDSTAAPPGDLSADLGPRSLNPALPPEGLSSANISALRVPPLAMKFFPSFMFDVKDAISNQDLNPMQIRDLIHRYLDDTEKLYLAELHRVQYQALTNDKPAPGRDPRDAALAPTTDSPETTVIKNRPSDETNTSTNMSSDKDVLDSNGEPDQRKVTEVLTFDPVGHLKSSFGHTAININGKTYAFTEKGWSRPENTEDYLRRNDFRDAVGQELDLTPKEQDLLVKMIKQDMAENPKWSSQNSCVTKIRDVLEQATGRMFGFRPQPAIISPLDFRDNLDRFGYVVQKNWFRRVPILRASLRLSLSIFRVHNCAPGASIGKVEK